GHDGGARLHCRFVTSNQVDCTAVFSLDHLDAIREAELDKIASLFPTGGGGLENGGGNREEGGGVERGGRRGCPGVIGAARHSDPRRLSPTSGEPGGAL